ncbi:MAG TPA: hypothetical protein VNA14_10380 [Mycobacteriales bacterium]|nr:hypothetical protein [Mycobacteriales bacterium]
MDLESAVAEAIRIRAVFEAYERREYGREWSLSDLVAGLATDVGDLARLVAAKQGIRPAPEDLDAALAHEVADCLWAVFVIASKVDVDVPTAYEAGMRDLRRWLASQDST